jgi:hypothetical protein
MAQTLRNPERAMTARKVKTETGIDKVELVRFTQKRFNEKALYDKNEQPFVEGPWQNQSFPPHQFGPTRIGRK